MCIALVRELHTAKVVEDGQARKLRFAISGVVDDTNDRRMRPDLYYLPGQPGDQPRGNL